MQTIQKQQLTKSITIRVYSQADSDLIEMAIARSGVTQSDWARNALLLYAELQVMNGGVTGLTLKSILLLRRLIQISGDYSKQQILEAMEWSAVEFDKIFNQTERG